MQGGMARVHERLPGRGIGYNTVMPAATSLRFEQRQLEQLDAGPARWT